MALNFPLKTLNSINSSTDVWPGSTCGCGLAQQCVGGLHCGHHGAGGGVCDGGGVVGVLRLRAAVPLQPLRLREHGLTSERC